MLLTFTDESEHPATETFSPGGTRKRGREREHVTLLYPFAAIGNASILVAVEEPSSREGECRTDRKAATRHAGPPLDTSKVGVTFVAVFAAAMAVPSVPVHMGPEIYGRNSSSLKLLRRSTCVTKPTTHLVLN